MALTTVVSNEDLVVLGPPSSVSVSVDIGATGERGASFYTGFGDPNTNSLFYSSSDLPKIGDLYLRRDLGANYGVIYRLVTVTGGTSWQSVLKFQPITYNLSTPASFNSGVASVTFPLEDFYFNAPIDLNVQDIIIQATVELDNPVMLSISNKEIKTVSSVKSLITEITAAQLSSGTVSLLSGSATIVNLGYSLGV
jgi:hypothetical protein